MDQEYFICGLCKWVLMQNFGEIQNSIFLVELFLKEAFVFIGQT